MLQNFKGNPITMDVINAWGNLRISTEISVYLGNGTR